MEHFLLIITNFKICNCITFLYSVKIHLIHAFGPCYNWPDVVCSTLELSDGFGDSCTLLASSSLSWGVRLRGCWKLMAAARVWRLANDPGFFWLCWVSLVSQRSFLFENVLNICFGRGTIPSLRSWFWSHPAISSAAFRECPLPWPFKALDSWHF